MCGAADRGVCCWQPEAQFILQLDEILGNPDAGKLREPA